MPNYRRSNIAGATYFFTVNTYRRQQFLTDSDVRAALRAGIERVRQTLPFAIDAWVLLPDHLHCLWTLPKGDADFSTRWRVIKTTVTQCCGPRLNNPAWLTRRRAAKGQGTLWQQRFWEHLIRDERDYAAHVDYIHWNPVKHRYAKEVAHWPYSSFHNHVRSGLLPAGWAGVDVDGEFGEAD